MDPSKKKEEKMVREPKIKGRYRLNGKTYVCEADGETKKLACAKCAFGDGSEMSLTVCITTRCQFMDRPDGRNIYFREVIPRKEAKDDRA